MTINITVTDETVQPEIYLGRQGEKNYREIVFDLSVLRTKYGTGTATLYHQRSQDVAPYLVGTTTGSSLTWTVSDTDTVYAGIGYAEFRYEFDTDSLHKTTIFATNVKESLAGDVVIPEPLEAWYDAMIEYGDEHWSGGGSSAVTSVDGKTGAVTVLPSGGSSGYVLAKNSATDYDVKWVSETVRVPTCATAAETQKKTASCKSFSLATDSWFPILVANANSYNGAITLNVNSTGEKPIYINGSASSSSNKTLPAGMYLVYYDGTNYQFRTDGKLPGTTTGNYVKPSGGIPKTDLASAVQSALVPAGGSLFNVLTKGGADDYNTTWSAWIYSTPYSTTGGSTAAKTANCSRFALNANSWLPVLIGYSNSYAGAITLNINSTGAKSIYINGAASSATNYTLPQGLYLVFYDGTNYYFRTDGKLTGHIPAPASPSNGDFLVYSNGQWVAQSLSTWSGGSY